MTDQADVGVLHALRADSEIGQLCRGRRPSFLRLPLSRRQRGTPLRVLGIFQITTDREMEAHGNRAESQRSTSTDRKSYFQRVAAVGPDGVVLEYDLPPSRAVMARLSTCRSAPTSLRFCAGRSTTTVTSSRSATVPPPCSPFSERRNRCIPVRGLQYHRFSECHGSHDS